MIFFLLYFTIPIPNCLSNFHTSPDCCSQYSIFITSERSVPTHSLSFDIRCYSQICLLSLYSFLHYRHSSNKSAFGPLAIQHMPNLMLHLVTQAKECCTSPCWMEGIFLSRGIVKNTSWWFRSGEQLFVIEHKKCLNRIDIFSNSSRRHV